MWKVILFIIGGVCASSRGHGDNGGGGVTEPPEEGTNVVDTTYGRVQGFPVEGVLRFIDIPYGAFKEVTPFQEPAEPEPWYYLLNKTEHESLCPQIKDGGFIGTNGCLTLSIFKGVNVSVSEPIHAVLFHIHDSYFSTGSGNPLVYEPKNLVDKDIIVVLPNYRLGALGFMCLHNGSAPGNAALKDLTLALSWTKKNIEKFGGDPSKIVVSGAGAGAALVEYLLISDASRPYIARAITESGSSLSPWAIDRDPLATASSLPPTVLQGTIENIVNSSHHIDFRPCIEKEKGFITESPWKLLGNQSNIVYMAGTANHAAWDSALRLARSEEKLAELNDDLTLLLPDDLIFENREEKLRVARRVKSLYFGERDITATDVNQLSQLFTDTGYLNPVLRGARLLVKGGAKVYFYEYSVNNPELQQAFDASRRGDSVAFVFSSGRPGETTEQATARCLLTSFWSRFIKDGNPAANKISWKPLEEVAPEEEEWMSIDADTLMRKGLHSTRLRVWQEIYDRHFVDNNVGLVHGPSVYILVSALSILSFMAVNY